MPKLSARQATQVDEAEEVQTGGFEAWPDGRYRAVLDSVEERDSAAGNKYWSAAFRDFENEDGEKQRGRQWYRLMLPITKMPKDYLPGKMRNDGLTVKDVLDDPDLKEEREKSWKQYQNLTAARIKEFFAAFGLTADSETEEAEGLSCGVQVGHETQQAGANKGAIRNTVVRVFPESELGWDEESAEDTY